MAVVFYSSNPKQLLADFDARIGQTAAKGKIETWKISDDGKYYTHKAKDWEYKAWFKPAVGTDRLTFNIIKPKDANVSAVAYAYYHGHLIETFLNHFDKTFTSGAATALPANGDIVG